MSNFPKIWSADLKFDLLLDGHKLIKKKHRKIYKITMQITLGSTRNQNGYNKNCQKIN